MQLIALRHYSDDAEDMTDRLFRNGDAFKLQESAGLDAPLTWCAYTAADALAWVMDDPASVEWIAADAPSCEVMLLHPVGKLPNAADLPTA
jgi:hypothetical protein